MLPPKLELYKRKQTFTVAVASILSPEQTLHGLSVK